MGLHIIWLQIQKSNSALFMENNSTQVIPLGVIQVGFFLSVFLTHDHIILFKVNDIKRCAQLLKRKPGKFTLLSAVMDTFPGERLGLCLWTTWSLRSDV